MEENIDFFSTETNDFANFFEELKPPQGERWAPVGQAASISSPETVIATEPKSTQAINDKKIHDLENEKDQLQSSLFSLTSRFAQIQFHLQQIIEAAPEDKDDLLRNLGELADKECIDTQAILSKKETNNQETAETKHEEIINELKLQLDDLERYAYKQGSGAIPQSEVLKKQQVVLEQLMEKLNLSVKVDDLAQASVEDLRSKVDDAVAEIVNPAKIKEKLVDHLQTQIQDLERFVEFLQVEEEAEGGRKKSSGSIPSAKYKERKQNIAMLRRMLNIMQVFAISQLGCGTKSMQEETIQEVKQRKSVQPLLDELKKAVNNVRTYMTQADSYSNSDEDCENELFYNQIDGAAAVAVLAVDNEITQLVRKELCPPIMNLLSHGLVYDATVSSTMGITSPFTCLLPRKMNYSLSAEPIHPWELFMEYYEIKNGEKLAKSPSRMLTRSFGLDDLVAKEHGTRSSFLEAMNMVLHDHNPLKRSYDVMFKALVCIGLNSGKLTSWIRILMKCSPVISSHYTEYSYVAQTSFEGAITVLRKLDQLPFNLPVDIATRPFKNIKDAF